MDEEIWTEKYRPTTLDEIVGQDAVVRTLKWYIERGDMPNVLLYGKPGVGKTALVHAFAREVFGDYFHENFKETNASNERGIDVIRGPVKQFADFAPDGDFAFKILYLGEIDGLTSAAQDALKRTIETSHDTVRFMADCNNVNALIPAIKSRFVRIYVPPVEDLTVAMQLDKILRREELIELIDPEVLRYIVRVTNGDMRNALQILQSLPYDGNPLTVDFVKQLAPLPEIQSVAKLVNAIATGADYREKETIIQQLMRDSGYDAVPILQTMYDLIFKKETNNLVLKCQLLDTVGEYLYRVTQNIDQMVQLRCCVSQLQLVMGVA